MEHFSIKHDSPKVRTNERGWSHDLYHATIIGRESYERYPFKFHAGLGRTFDTDDALHQAMMESLAIDAALVNHDAEEPTVEGIVTYLVEDMMTTVREAFPMAHQLVKLADWWDRLTNDERDELNNYLED